MGDNAKKEIRERVWVEKFDHEHSDVPQLVETRFVEVVRTEDGTETQVGTSVTPEQGQP